jgi:protein ImuA
VTLGIEAVDATLGAGLNCEAVHEIVPAAAGDLAAATGFALALATRAGHKRRQVLYVQHDYTAWEGAPPYAPGLAQAGIAPQHLVHLRVAHIEDALWALAEALKCRAFAAVIGEFPPQANALDLTATRRLVLAAQAGDGFGLLLRHAPGPDANAATTRWQVAASPSASDEFGGIGMPVFALELLKNRFGPCGHWTLGWNHHDKSFVETALSLGLARAPVDGPDRTQIGAGAR